MASKTFDQLLSDAEEQLWLGFKRAGAKRHTVLRGGSREEALADFLTAQLPSRFAVTQGEAVDAKENRTTQLDVIVYDRNLTAPLLSEKSGDLLPAEALLAVVEVKSTLTKAELEKCARAARSLSALQPYGKQFLPPRKAGEAAVDGQPRCLYSVIAFSSDLGETDWAKKEWRRLHAATKAASVDVDRVDRVLVLDRGMLVPPWGRARVSPDQGKGMLREWFLHVTNFLVREASRRPGFDFERYGRKRKNPNWQELGDPDTDEV